MCVYMYTQDSNAKHFTNDRFIMKSVPIINDKVNCIYQTLLIFSSFNQMSLNVLKNVPSCDGADYLSESQF